MAESYKWIVLNGTVERLSDGAFIPNDPGNNDWKFFQDWLTAGNLPIPPDPPPTAVQVTADQRVQANNLFFNDFGGVSKCLRGILLVIKDELNILRQRDVDRAVDVAAATSLADLKVRWAARSALDPRTTQQAKAAVANQLDGAAD